MSRLPAAFWPPACLLLSLFCFLCLFRASPGFLLWPLPCSSARWLFPGQRAHPLPWTLSCLPLCAEVSATDHFCFPSSVWVGVCASFLPSCPALISSSSPLLMILSLSAFSFLLLTLFPPGSPLPSVVGSLSLLFHESWRNALSCSLLGLSHP